MTPSFTLKTSARRMSLPALLAALSLTSFTAFAQPDRVVSVDGPVPAGNYRNVTINSGISATLAGAVNVTGVFTVKSDAELAIGDNDFITGNSFVLENDGGLRLGTQIGIDGTTSGPIRTVNKNLGTKGRFIFNNASRAQLTGPNFPDEVSELVINNASGLGVGLSRPVGVRERLYLRNGVLRTNGFKLTLISRQPDIAMVTAASCVVFQQNGTVIGDVTAQRYINPRYNAGVGYRHFSTSVTGPMATIENFSSPSNFDVVLNNQYNTTPYPQRLNTAVINPFPNVFYYDETQVGTGPTGSYDFVFQQGYLAPTSLSQPLENTRGYTVRIPASSIVEFTGTLNNGTITTPLLTRGPLNESGWHLVGNPYATKIDWTLLTRTGMFNSFYKNRSNGTYGGVYDSYVDGVGTGPSGNEFIAANQAVFVRVAEVGVPGQIEFSNSARIYEFRNDPTAPFFRSGAANTTNPLVRLAIQSRNADSLEMQAVIRFRQGATVNTDTNYDAFFIDGGYPVNIYSKVGIDNLSINSLPELTATADYTVALMANIRDAGNYQINAMELLSLPVGFEVLLQDAVTGTTQNLTTNPIYSFTAAGQWADAARFTVRLRTSGVTGVTADAAARQAFDVYPNPVKTAERLNVSLPGVEAGKNVNAVIVNQLGQRVWSKTFRSALGGVREDINPDLARGVYTLQVTLPDGAKLSRRVVVK